MPEITSPLIVLIVVGLLSYLVGSTPFGIVISKLFGLPDPRTIGSKNIGATNVLRSGSKPAAFLTVLLDGAKGGIAVLVARALVGEDAAQVAALTSFLGHLYPVWLKFKGGKGVATLFGTLLCLSPVIGALAMFTWLAVFLLSRISSLSALVATAATPIIAIAFGQNSMVALLILMSALVWWRHRANLGRLANGTEPKSSFSGKS